MTDSGTDFHTLFGRRPRIVIGHPTIRRGGSEARVLWLAEALKRDCDVAIMTTGGWNLAELNEYYGTSLREEDVTVRMAPPARYLQNMKADALRGALYQRFARHISAEYDLRISAYNPTDWGLPAIHFIADFSWLPCMVADAMPRPSAAIHRDTALRRVYVKICNVFAKPSSRDPISSDHVIANSLWSAQQLQDKCGVLAHAVVYPAVWSTFPECRWSDKDQSFVVIGRVAPEKRIEMIFSILSKVRQLGHTINLHLCGEIGNDSYGRKIAGLCEDNNSWVIREGRISGQRKTKLLARCRFGIQACAIESFGISAAEMVKAGMIVFAPNKGGQVEIINHPELLYTDENDAVLKINAIMASTERQARLHIHLKGMAGIFSAERFMQEAREQIAQAAKSILIESLQ